MLFAVGAQLLGRQREREVLDRPAGRRARRRRRRCWWCTESRASARLRCSITRSRRARQFRVAPDRRGRRRDGARRSRRFNSCARPILDLIGASARIPSATRSASPSGSVPDSRRIRSLSDWRSSACCPRLPRSGRSCASSMTRSGSIVRRRARSRSWPAACWRSGSRSCSRRASSATRSRDCRSSTSSRLGHRDARALLESVLPAPLDERVLERIVVETRGNPLALLELPRGLTPAQLAGGFGLPAAVPLSGEHRGELHAAAGEASAMTRDACCSSRRPTRSATRRSFGGRREQLGIPESAAETVEAEGLLDARRPSGVPSSAGSLGRLSAPPSRRSAARSTARWRRQPIRRSTRIAAPGTGRRRHPCPTRTSPQSSSVPPGGRRRAAAWRLSPPSSSAPPTLTPEPTHRAQRLLAAAGAKRDAGALEAALGLLAGVDAEALDELGRARRPSARPDRAGAAARRRRRPPVSERGERASSHSTRS